MRGANRLAITAGGALAAVALGAGTASAATFSNTAPIAIPLFSNAAPYPSQITVTGQAAPISDLNVNLSQYSHGEPDDVGAVLVGPGGQGLLLMARVGDLTDATNLDFKLDDSAAAFLPDNGTLVSGSFKPANYFPGPPNFPAPGPFTGYSNPGPIAGFPATFASTFNGTSANGIWSLFVRNFSNGGSGQFAGGWSLEVSPDPAPAAATPIAIAKKCKKKRSAPFAKKKKKCKKKRKK